MGYTVLLKQTDGHFVGRAPSLPECVVHGGTREETLEKLRSAMAKALEGTEVLTVEVDAAQEPSEADPWLQARDMFRDDPDYGQVLAEISAYRKSVDDECAVQ